MTLTIDSFQAYRGTFTAGPLDVRLEAGDCLVLMGTNGAGKTTLLEALAGFVAGTAGRILLDGTDVTDLSPEQRHFAYLPQDLALFPHLDVARNVGFAAPRRAGAAPRAELARLLDEFQLGGLGRRYPFQLSRGQAQRVAFARAVAAQPRVLLLDEPAASLDRSGRQSFNRHVRDLLSDRRLTIIHATHDVLDSMSLATVLVALENGRVAQAGPPMELFHHPVDAQVAALLGITNQWRTRVVRRTDEGVYVTFEAQELFCHRPADGDGTLLAVIGPGEVELLRHRPDDRANCVLVVVEAVQLSGQAALVDLDSAVGTLRAVVPPPLAEAFQPQAACWLRLPPDQLRLVRDPS